METIKVYESGDKDCCKLENVFLKKQRKRWFFITWANRWNNGGLIQHIYNTVFEMLESLNNTWCKVRN
jgi:hypothetical protein